MGYTLSGWADVPVQIRFILDSPDQVGEFLQGLQQSVLGAYVKPQGATEMRESLGALTPGQMEHTLWVRLVAPVEIMPVVVGQLTELCNKVFPRVRGDDGQGPTASY